MVRCSVSRTHGAFLWLEPPSWPSLPTAASSLPQLLDKHEQFLRAPKSEKVGKHGSSIQLTSRNQTAIFLLILPSNAL